METGRPSIAGVEAEEGYKHHYLMIGGLFAPGEPHIVATVLGSCVSVCLWDPVLRQGGINHFMMPLWNGDGLSSPKYGNIAVPKLIEKLIARGSQKRNIKAKVFGGAALFFNRDGLVSVGERNISVALDILKEEQIPVLSSDVGGNMGRKIIFFTDTGVVRVKKLRIEKKFASIEEEMSLTNRLGRMQNGDKE